MTILGGLGVASLGLVSGLSIGCIGIGGVVLVPALVQFGGVPIHQAITAAMAGFIVTGLVGTVGFARKGTLTWGATRMLWLGAIPAAILGALAAKATAAVVLEGVIAVLTAASGIQALRGVRARQDSAADAPILPSPVAVGAGAVTGFLSAWSGTGGPVVLIPLLLWLRRPVLSAIGLAQGIQLPIAVLATLSNMATGTFEPRLAVFLCAGLAVGTWGGTHLAHSIDQTILRRIVALLLLATSLLLLLKLAARSLA